MAWDEKIHTIKRKGESELEQQLLTSVGRDNNIKMNVVVVVVVVVDSMELI